MVRLITIFDSLLEYVSQRIKEFVNVAGEFELFMGGLEHSRPE